MKNYPTGFVTFMDILGWKGIWLKSDIDPLKTMNEILDRGKSFRTVLQKDFERKESIEIKAEISLISDTFVITTYMQDTPIDIGLRGLEIKTEEEKIENKSKEILLHGQIVKSIFLDCIENKLLLRGATSFGEFQHNNNSFVGPAIDEAASWHEMADMVTVFLTPSALHKCKSDNLINDEGVWHSYKPKLKVKDFDTFCINWRADYPQKKFQEEIILKNAPLIPAIAPKYLNTEEYLGSDKKTINKKDKASKKKKRKKKK
jgi:hypothetical protein